MGCDASKMSKNQVVDIDRREGARSGSSVSLPNWSPDAEKASSGSSVVDSITIVHFNDVYNIEQRPNGKEPIGGAARFKAEIDSLRHLEPLILFSGDALNPSNSQCLCTCIGRYSLLLSLCLFRACMSMNDSDKNTINPVNSGYECTLSLNPYPLPSHFPFVLSTLCSSLFLFSLVLFSLPTVSIVTEGRQMIPVLKAIGVHAAVYGNHDFGEICEFVTISWCAIYG